MVTILSGIIIVKNHQQNLYHLYHLQSQFHNVSTKISKSVGILYRMNYYLPSDILKLLYNSLILTCLTYGMESWYRVSRYMSGKVNVLQKKAIRNAYNLPYNSPTNQCFKSINILKLSDLYNPSLGSHVFNYIKSQNNNLTSRLHPNSEIHNHNTRNRTNLVVPRFNRSATQSNFMHSSITEWNKLFPDIK